MKILKLIFSIFFIHSLALNSQTYIVGNVKDAIGVLNGANVTIKGGNIGDFTDVDGNYKLSCTEGSHTVIVTFVGYKSIKKIINIKKNETKIVNFTLIEDANRLDDVIIIAKTKAEKLREESYAVDVIESKTFKNLSINANEVLTKVSGVNIRQSGGLGEDAVLSLNGLSGSQVRLFIDGIPMEYFGSSLSLNNFSANLIDQIEVYKGVVPIHLSSDALGGAINVTTNNNQKSFLDASYSLGSFNTHIVSVNGQYRNIDNGFTVRLKSFYNYSDNNYKLDVNLLTLDNTTGRADEFTTEVEHFHDAYKSKMAWGEIGFTKVDFADVLMLGVLYSDNYDEVQQPPNAIGDNANVFGDIIEKEKKVISTLNFSKNHFLHEKLSFKSYLVGVLSETYARDLSSYTYDWLGNKEIRTDADTGEAGQRKTELTIYSENILGNINLGYAFSDENNIAINYSMNFLDMDGDDSYNAENATRFGDPIAFNKQVIGASYTHSFFDSAFKNTIFSKYYNYTQTSTDSNFGGDVATPISANYEHLGYGLTATYFLYDFQFKASFEHTVRFPDVIELYGNGLGVDANQDIVPEESDNFNLGIIYKTNFNNQSVMISTNGFVRSVKDFIYIIPGIPSHYDNLAKILSRGVDFSANYNYKQKINLALAGTYTSKVNNEKYIKGSPNSLYGIRIPNDPYFYGNATLSFIKKSLFNDKDNISFTISENYTKEFYYAHSNLGNSENKYIIPSQLTTDLDLVYSAFKQRYNISFGVINVFNTKTYDNLFQQNPRRVLNFKLRYFIN